MFKKENKIFRKMFIVAGLVSLNDFLYPHFLDCVLKTMNMTMGHGVKQGQIYF